MEIFLFYSHEVCKFLGENILIEALFSELELAWVSVSRVEQGYLQTAPEDSSAQGTRCQASAGVTFPPFKP